MNRTDRLYALVERLRAVAPQPLSARRLAEVFEVSPRTIERDLSALQQSGVPIYPVAGRAGGYVVDRSRTLPPLNVTAEEATAIAVALATATGAPFTEAARSALRKLVAVMPTAEAGAAIRLAARVRIVDTAGHEPVPAPPRALTSALVGDKVVQIDYVDRRGGTSDRVVEPISLVRGPDRWYLLAWCRLRGGSRWFRVDRIGRVVPTGERAAERCVEEMLRHYGGAPPTRPVELV
jgi:predicted DNA-binding transcriptional regulator YafY